MQNLTPVASIHPGIVTKIYATDKKFYFVNPCVINSINRHRASEVGWLVVHFSQMRPKLNTSYTKYVPRKIHPTQVRASQNIFTQHVSNAKWFPPKINLAKNKSHKLFAYRIKKMSEIFNSPRSLLFPISKRSIGEHFFSDTHDKIISYI